VKAFEPMPDAMTVATVNPVTMQPSVRCVLLKDHNEDGFVFYTNAESRKGGELRAHSKVRSAAPCD
jgi:pyridoxamine 5'-phosphate oxidase